jgi:hypothetical protein
MSDHMQPGQQQLVPGQYSGSSGGADQQREIPVNTKCLLGGIVQFEQYAGSCLRRRAPPQAGYEYFFCDDCIHRHPWALRIAGDHVKDNRDPYKTTHILYKVRMLIGARAQEAQQQNPRKYLCLSYTWADYDSDIESGENRLGVMLLAARTRRNPTQPYEADTTGCNFVESQYSMCTKCWPLAQEQASAAPPEWNLLHSLNERFSPRPANARPGHVWGKCIIPFTCLFIDDDYRDTNAWRVMKTQRDAWCAQRNGRQPPSCQRLIIKEKGAMCPRCARDLCSGMTPNDLQELFEHIATPDGTAFGWRARAVRAPKFLF